MMLLFDDQKRLTETFTPEQAEVLAHILEKQAERQKEELATKRDLEQGLRELELRLKHDLTLRLGTISAAVGGFVVALVKLL